MVSFVDDILKSRLNKQRGFASRDVLVLDPAMGAGTFLAEILENAANTLREERKSNSIPATHLRELFEERLMGFEIQAAPFAVAELRLHAALKNRYRVELPAAEPRFLTDTLDDPYVLALQFGQLYDVLTESRERANKVKREIPVMVVIGNPPWRERARGAAKWIEEKRNPTKPIDKRVRPSLDEFRIPGGGKLDFNLNNMWTYFWRWSAWKAFEANDPVGIVALITPSAYLTSKSYAGMRQYLRQTADEGWIIDLSPEEHRSDTRTRIFPETQHTICIGVFMRSGDPQPTRPAKVHYIALSGTQDEKFKALGEVTTTGSHWRGCPTAWQGVFRPSNSAWESYPSLGDLLPWHQTGVNSNRNWVWAPDSDTLLRRWSQLILADPDEKATLFKETRDRKIDKIYPPLSGSETTSNPIVDDHAMDIQIVDVAFRSFDRQKLVFDSRVIDFPRAELWQTLSQKQIYTCEQHAHPIPSGPGLTFTALVPNVDCFNGRGGRVLPLFRDTSGELGNLPPSLTRALMQFIGCRVDAEDVLAYIAGIVAHGGYTRRFRDQLRTPGVRVPITLNKTLWQESIRIGRRIIWLHTYGERLFNARQRPYRLGVTRRATYTSPVQSGDDQLPTSVQYEEETETIVIGEDTLFTHAGRVTPVNKKTWEYTVGGVNILRKWFSYRHPNPRRRRRTSPLDDINPRRWTAEFDDELLNLIEVIAGCVELEPAQEDLLERICAGPILTVDDLRHESVLPAPPAYQKPPGMTGLDLLA